MARQTSPWRQRSAAVGTVVGLGLAALSGAIANITPTPTPPTTSTVLQSRAPTRHPAGSVAVQALVLPGPPLHPGAIDPTWTKKTLCAPSFRTSSVRPPTSYTGPLKQLELGGGGTITRNGATYTVVGEHLPGTVSDYELDHLISLELGGNPQDPRNLWMEPWERRGQRLAPTGTGAEAKDVVENRLHREVCAGTISLSQAQHDIATDWTTAK